ncbi:MAG: 30S ribosomal protein S8, partial [Planctomycetes bacterium]|nr:30S ribosomal protein S8 [Planctomycetota bacterium]
MLTRIRNANSIRQPKVHMPASRQRVGVAQVLKAEGFIHDYRVEPGKPSSTLHINLKYGQEGERVIRRIDRVSKPGRRIYAGVADLRPILRGQASPAEYGLVRFGPSSVLAIDGLVFDRIGRTGSPFAIEILPGANVSSFNYVRITDAQSTAAAIQLSTDNLPKVIQEFEVSGTAPTNIDASAVSNFRVEIKKSTTGAGTRYGVPFEEDPNGVLFWEDPPVVSLLSGSNIPNVLAETSFTHQLSASGGNEPLHWTLLNAPSWLSISASGELSGTPPRAAIGTHVFVVFISDSTNPSLTASEVMTLIVDALSEVPITVITPELVTGKVGETYSFSLSAAGGSGVGFTWTLVDANALPMGLELRPDGVIYGMPDASAAGAYSFAVRVTDSQGNSQVKIYEIVIQTEYSDPVAINAALTDGANGGGGCALSSGSTALAFLLAMLAGLALWRRRES